MKRFNKTAVNFFCFTLTLCCFTQAAWGLTATAQKIYGQLHSSVYQIRVIDVNSGEKYVIGSGFRFAPQGNIATNYHVISDAAAKPERYRIEYYQGSKKKGNLTLAALDAVHDLAILQGADNGDAKLVLQTSAMAKGDPVFPMGNPLDLGMTINEGIYNGLVGDSPYQRILLSASLNGGMSGGPAFNSAGEVIGVNVSIQGNDLSYLVPATYLAQLAEKANGDKRPQDWRQTIEDQVLKKYDHTIRNILAGQWSFEKFGSLKVPKTISADTLKCWGQSREEDTSKSHFYSYGYRSCESGDSIYLSSSLRTGEIGFSFYWLKSVSLNPLEFYKKYSKQFGNANELPSAIEKDTEEPRCKTSFVTMADHNWKAAYCVRPYKDYPGLNDIFLALAVLGEPKRGHIINVYLTGLGEPLAGLFLKKLLGGIKWVD